MLSVTKIRTGWAEIHTVTPEACVPSTTSQHLFTSALARPGWPIPVQGIDLDFHLERFALKKSHGAIKMNVAIYYPWFLEEPLMITKAETIWIGLFTAEWFEPCINFFKNQWITDSEEMMEEETDFFKTW